MTDKGARSVEYVLACFVLAGLVHAVWFLWEYKYLGPPFFYMPSDTFMDWFNTAYWAHQPGAYDVWRTLYTPLSFVFMRMFTDGRCYEGAEGPTGRDCDLYGLISLFAWYVACCIVVIIALFKADRKTAIPRSVAIIFGLPLLYGLERGNMVLPTFFFFVLAFSSIFKQARLRWLSLAIAINFKIYLIGALAPQLLRRRWRAFEGITFMAVGLYLLGVAVLGEGFPEEIFFNIVDSREEYQAIGFLDSWNASTYIPLQSLLSTNAIPILAILGSDLLEGLELATTLLPRGAQLIIMLGAVAGWYRPEAVSMHRLTALGVGMVMITSETMGYTQTLITFLAFQEKFKKPGPIIAILTCYILSVPYDFLIDRITQTVEDSYLYGARVIVDNVLTLGPFVRPLLVIIIPVALAIQTIVDVARDAQSADIASRQRFANDFKLTS